MAGNPNPYCNVPNPDPRYYGEYEVTMTGGQGDWVDRPTVFCRRLEGHLGDHAAVPERIAVMTVESWPR